MFVNSENRFLLTLTLPSWLLSCLISNVFTTAQYNAVKNAESRDR